MYSVENLIFLGDEKMRYLWEPYLSYGHQKRLAKGEVLFLQGENGSGFYYLKQGRMNISLSSEEGKERIIDYLPNGYLLGEQGIFEGAYSTTAVCETDVHLYYFSYEALNHILQIHPEAKDIFMTSLISKVRILAQTITMINKPFEQQMAYFLIQLANRFSNLSIPITQIALAKYIGTSRITVHKIFQNWIKEELVAPRFRGIDILDPHSLKALYISSGK